MVDSGIKVCPSCDPIITDLEANKLEYAIFRIESYFDEKKGKDTKRVVVDETSAKGESATLLKDKDIGNTPPEWYRFSSKMQESEARYGCCHFKYQTRDGRTEGKLLFVYWCCDDKACIKDKMTYSSTQRTVSRKIKSAGPKIQCGDSDQFDYEEVVKLVKKNK